MKTAPTTIWQVIATQDLIRQGQLEGEPEDAQTLANYLECELQEMEELLPQVKSYFEYLKEEPSEVVSYEELTGSTDN